MVPITAKALFRDLWPAAPAGVSVTSVVTDSRGVIPGSVFMAIKGERVDGHDFAGQAYNNGAAFVVAQHPIDTVPMDRTVLVGDVLDAMIEMGMNYRDQFSPLLLGVTGSVGKTTTKEFCAAIFSSFGETLKTEGNQNNEIGMPNTLFRLNDSVRYAVVEMGMQGLGEIRKLTLAARPNGALITRIGQAHIEHLGSVENILRAKMEICAGLPAGAPLILNGDDELLFTASIPEGIRPVFAGLENEEVEVRAKNIIREGYGQRFRIKDAQYGDIEAYIPALGKHNIVNAILAYTAATRLGLNAEQSAAALANYEPSGMRQRIRDFKGANIIEDCYNASPDSMVAALSTLEDLAEAGRKIAVLGDMLELGKIGPEAHSKIGAACAEKGVDVLITIGDLSQYIGEEASRLGIKVYSESTNQEAINVLKQLIEPGDTVLIKASRGMRFEEILEGLQE